jgi:hypothetical protein
MADDIFLIQDNGTLIEMGEKQYDSEALLQGLLAEYPKLLAGGQIDSASPRRWLLIKREMGIPAEEEAAERWSVDHLFLDQDAIPTLVEVKRSSDTRIRRAVVGQMLDYAANAVVYWPATQSGRSLRRPARPTTLIQKSGLPGFWGKKPILMNSGRGRGQTFGQGKFGCCSWPT